LEQNRWSAAETIRRVLSALVLVHTLFLVAMAQCESLHRMVHSHAGEETHHCVVTLFRNGQVEAPSCAVVAGPAVIVSVVLVVMDFFFVPSVDYSLPPGCGPPALHT
jgi:hypothetical protein